MTYDEACVFHADADERFAEDMDRLDRLADQAPAGSFTDDEVRDAALTWAREHAPVDCLPRGVRGTARVCPLAKATGLMVSGHVAYGPESEGRPIFNLPRLVEEFVKRFDRGDFPDLDEDRGE